MSPDTETVVVEADLDEAPEKVWRALTRPELVAEWLAPTDLKAQDGAAFRIAGMPETGPVECEVLEADPPHALRYSWRAGEAAPGAAPSEVAFQLTRTETGGTFLRVVHSGIPRTLATPLPANDASTTVMQWAA